VVRIFRVGGPMQGRHAYAHARTDPSMFCRLSLSQKEERIKGKWERKDEKNRTEKKREMNEEDPNGKGRRKSKIEQSVSQPVCHSEI